MNLSELLEQRKLNRNTFNWREREGWYPFLARDPSAGRDQFDERHALAMAAHEALVLIGVKPAIAGQACNAAFGKITAAAEGRASGEDANFQVGITYIHDSSFPGQIRHGYTAWSDEGEIGRTYVDLRAVSHHKACPEW